MAQQRQRVLVTGGAGYVGAVLVPKLLEAGYDVNVLDLYMFGGDVLDPVKHHPGLRQVKGDLRDPDTVQEGLKGCSAVIHLACISNDPSFELNPELGKSINYDCFRPLVRAAKKAGVTRFIYASSSSVYGVKTGSVTENAQLDPLTDYSKFKAMCERVLEEEHEPGFTTLTLRPATVCGYSRRQRLDVIVNILTNHAVNTHKIKVFGGSQLRPNLHIEDMTDLYLLTLKLPSEQIDGRIFNAGYENRTVMELATLVQHTVGEDVKLEVTPTNDNRSYHVSSDLIKREIGYVPRHTIENAVQDLLAAFHAGKLPDAMNDPRYYNIKTMQDLKLK